MYYVALQLDLATRYLSNFFYSCVAQVNGEISFIWVPVWRRQVNVYTDYLSCIMNLDKYLCLTLFNQHVLKEKCII